MQDKGNSNLKMLRNIGIVASVIGAIITGYGYYKYDEAKKMSKVLSDGQDLFGISSSSSKALNIWSENEGNYKIVIIVGCVILIVGIIMLVSGLMNAENKKIKDDVKTESVQESKDVVDRLKQLEELKKSGLITEEEYERKRKDVLSSL